MYFFPSRSQRCAPRALVNTSGSCLRDTAPYVSSHVMYSAVVIVLGALENIDSLIEEVISVTSDIEPILMLSAFETILEVLR